MALNGAQLAHPEVVPQLLQRRDALFGAIVGPWNLSAAVDGLAADVGRNGLEGVAVAARPGPAPGRPARRVARAHTAGPGPGGDRADLGDAAEGGAGLLRRPRGALSPSRARRPGARRCPAAAAYDSGSLRRSPTPPPDARTTMNIQSPCRRRPRRHRAARRPAAPPSPPRPSSTAPKAAPRASTRSSSRPARRFDAVVGADLQPAGRVRDRHDQHRPRPGRELDRRARRPQLHVQAAQGRQVPQQREVHADARLQRRRRAVLVQPHGRPEPSVRAR